MALEGRFTNILNNNLTINFFQIWDSYFVITGTTIVWQVTNATGILMRNNALNDYEISAFFFFFFLL